MRDQLLFVLNLLVTLFGRVPKIGPALQVLLMLVQQFWPEVNELVKKLPVKVTAAVTSGKTTRASVKAKLLSRCKAVGDE